MSVTKRGRSKNAQDQRLLRIRFYRALETLAHGGQVERLQYILKTCTAMIDDLEAVAAAEELILDAAAKGEGEP